MTPAQGLESVFLAHRLALLRFLTSRLRDAALAEDVAQDLWIKLKGLNCGPIADPLAYLYRMAENLARDRRRSAVRREARQQEWALGQADGTPIALQPSAERMLVARDDLSRVLAAIDLLPDRTAWIFRAARLDAIPQKEIAMRLGISLRAVEKHLQRAYRHILDRLRDGDTEAPAVQRHIDEGSDHAEP